MHWQITTKREWLTNRDKPYDSSMLLFAADVKLRVDVILAEPTCATSGPADRRGELVEVASLAWVTWGT